MLVYWVSHSPLKHWYLGLNTPFLDKFTTCAWVWVPSTWYSAVHTKIAGKSMVHPPKWTKKHKRWIVLAHPQWKCFSVSGRHVPSCSSPSLGGKVSSIFQVEDIPKIMEPFGKCWIFRRCPAFPEMPRKPQPPHPATPHAMVQLGREGAPLGSSPTCDEPSTRYRWFSTVHSNHSIPTVHSRFQQLWLEWWCSPTLGKGRWLDFTHPTCDFFRDVWSKMGWTHRNSAKDWSTHRKLTEPLGLTSLARLLWGVDQQEGL